MAARAPFLLCVLAVLAPIALAPVAAPAQTLQEEIDAAAPGDTVLVLPGDYPRPITVDKSITIRATGPGVRLAGITGSAARIRGLVLDGSLDPTRLDLVVAGSGLSLHDCTFQNGIRGVLVQEGAVGVELVRCALHGLLEGVTLEDVLAVLRVEDSDIVDCTRGLTTLAVPACTPLPRGPAAWCETGTCGRVQLVDTRFTRGARQIDLAGALVLELDGVEATEGDTALHARSLRIEIDRSRFIGKVNHGVGLDLEAVSGSVERTRISGWEIGVRAGDLGCHAHTSIVLGGSEEGGNDLVSNPISLDVIQPEWIDASYNFWGSLVCAQVAASVRGMEVRIIMSDDHRFGVVCAVATKASTWGLLKSRFGRDGS